MNHNQIDNAQQLRLHFKQWSNRGYAAFCSIGKVVHIGNLAIYLAQWIGIIIEQIEETLHLFLEKENDEETEEVLEQELIKMNPVITSTNVRCEISVLKKSINIICR